MDEYQLNRLKEAFGPHSGRLSVNGPTLDDVRELIKTLVGDLKTVIQWYSNTLRELQELKQEIRWSAESPTKPGFYFIMELGMGEVEPCEVVQTEDGLRVWILGEPGVLYPEDIAWWAPMQIPDLPIGQESEG